MLSLALSGSLWLSLALSGSPWLSLALSGSLWLSLALSCSNPGWWDGTTSRCLVAMRERMMHPESLCNSLVVVGAIKRARILRKRQFWVQAPA